MSMINHQIWGAARSPHYPPQGRYCTKKFLLRNQEWKTWAERCLVLKSVSDLTFNICKPPDAKQSWILSAASFHPKSCPAMSSPGNLQPRLGVTLSPLYKPLMGNRSQTGCQVRSLVEICWNMLKSPVDLETLATTWKKSSQQVPFCLAPPIHPIEFISILYRNGAESAI